MSVQADQTLADALNQAATPDAKVDVIFAYLRERGQSNYDEQVTQLEHALQAAHLARQSQAPPEQVVAALLHDIGHFLMDEHDEDSDFLKEDWYHETVGAEYLQPFFADIITESIRLHVPAKRYLCTVDPDYFKGLSRASVRSLELQGGTMSPEELAEMEQNPYCHVAVQVRRWDDGAKVNDLEVPDLEAYRQDVLSCLR